MSVPQSATISVLNRPELLEIRGRPTELNLPSNIRDQRDPTTTRRLGRGQPPVALLEHLRSPTKWLGTPAEVNARESILMAAFDSVPGGPASPWPGRTDGSVAGQGRCFYMDSTGLVAQGQSMLSEVTGTANRKD